MLEQDDNFYEGLNKNQIRFVPRNERPWYIWPLWLINSGYLWALRHYVPAGCTVMEIGCASGVRYFSTRYRMIGCDLSFSSLQGLDKLYEVILQADASRCLPLPDHSVDAVASSYFWEHIPPKVKPHILSEVDRILRPGGKLIFLYDVKTQNPLILSVKKRDQALYERLFIIGDGHLGYQSPVENLAIFQGAGFLVVAHRGMEKTYLQSPSVYTKLGQFGAVGDRLYLLAARLLGKKSFFYPYTALMRLIDTLICPWLPADWAGVDHVKFGKLSV